MDENTKNLDELQHASWNPRTISKQDFAALQNSIKQFGDLSGVILNLETGTLVGGNQRIEAFKRIPGAKIVITHRSPDGQPNAVGTVARGHIVVPETGEEYGYREVRWPLEVEKAANIAANRIQGQFDLELLAQVTAELKSVDEELLAATGQTEDEINKLLQMSSHPEIDLPAGDKAGFQQMTFTLSDEQAEVVQEAIEFIKQGRSFEGMENQNSNGNALFFVAQEFLDYTNGLKDEPSQTN